MMSEWRTIRAADFIDFNPRLNLKKGAITTKVAMDKLKPFTKKIPETEKAEFNGGAKFCNGDTVMARITPCLENGKTAYVDMLDDGEIGFGSTEFIVMRAKAGISDPQFVYYTAINPTFRNVAIKSMVGSSGRQRVQQSVLEELELSVPGLDEQRRIGAFLAELDEKIALNNKINDNLEQQMHLIFEDMMAKATNNKIKGEFIVAKSLTQVITGKEDANFSVSNGKYKFFTCSNTPLHCDEYAFNSSSVLIAGNGDFNVKHYSGKFNAYQRTYVLSPQKEYYAILYLAALYRINSFKTGSSGSIVKFITKSDVENIPVFMPHDSKYLDELNKLVIMQEQNMLENELLVQLRDWLLPMLMNGQATISD